MAPNADRTALHSRHASHVTRLVNAQASHSTLNTYHLRNGMEHRAATQNSRRRYLQLKSGRLYDNTPASITRDHMTTDRGPLENKTAE